MLKITEKTTDYKGELMYKINLPILMVSIVMISGVAVLFAQCIYAFFDIKKFGQIGEVAFSVILAVVICVCVFVAALKSDI